MPGVEKLSKPKSQFYRDDEPPPVSTIDPQTVLQSVLAQLGKPKDMAKSRATPITQTKFRVNIWRTEPMRISDSFFVEVDGLGEFVKSNPPITKKY